MGWLVLAFIFCLEPEASYLYISRNSRKCFQCGIGSSIGGNNENTNIRHKMTAIWCTFETKPQLEVCGSGEFGGFCTSSLTEVILQITSVLVWIYLLEICYERRLDNCLIGASINHSVLRSVFRVFHISSTMLSDLTYFTVNSPCGVLSSACIIAIYCLLFN